MLLAMVVTTRPPSSHQKHFLYLGGRRRPCGKEVCLAIAHDTLPLLFLANHRLQIWPGSTFSVLSHGSIQSAILRELTKQGYRLTHVSQMRFLQGFQWQWMGLLAAILLFSGDPKSCLLKAGLDRWRCSGVSVELHWHPQDD